MVMIVYGWAKLKNETENQMTIGYSIGENKDCDGVLVYNKISKAINAEALSKKTNLLVLDWFICPLRYRIKLGMELNKLYMIMTG